MMSMMQNMFNQFMAENKGNSLGPNNDYPGGSSSTVASSINRDYNHYNNNNDRPRKKSPNSFHNQHHSNQQYSHHHYHQSPSSSNQPGGGYERSHPMNDEALLPNPAPNLNSMLSKAFQNYLTNFMNQNGPNQLPQFGPPSDTPPLNPNLANPHLPSASNSVADRSYPHSGYYSNKNNTHDYNNYDYHSNSNMMNDHYNYGQYHNNNINNNNHFNNLDKPYSNNNLNNKNMNKRKRH